MVLGWSNFFFLVGSSAAGLIGLLFVVVTLTAGRERQAALRGTGLYMTPTVVHFAVVFTISAVTMIPGLGVRGAAMVFGMVALTGLACALRSAMGIGSAMRRAEQAHWSNFWLYGAAPVVLYLALITDAVGVWAGAGWVILGLAGVLLALLLLGIRNAWDTVTWLAPGPQGGQTPSTSV